MIPEPLLETFLNNYQGSGRRGMLEVNLIEGEVKNGKAEPINLSTKFGDDISIQYEYNIKDKVMQDTLPPSSIMIEKLPKNG